MTHLSAAQQAQIDNRDSSGQWKQKTHGDVEDTAEVLGVGGDDVGDQAYDSLTADEQAAWHAWRDMTGKAEETVIGPAKAADIADFKQHYLTSSSDDGPPDAQTAQRLGLDADELEAERQWSEMISAGTIEQHQDEDGVSHSFAHPHLARALATGEQPRSPAPAPVVDEDDDDTWEHIEPDFDDYETRAQDAVRLAGLENLQRGEIYWDYEQAYSSAKPAGHTDSLGFEASGSFADVDTDYLPEELAERVQRHSGGRELNISNYADYAQRSQVGERAQFVSVSLNDAERQAVIDHLDDHGEEFTEELVDHWSRGDPKRADDTFGFVSTHREWQTVSEAVNAKAPDAAHALQTASDLRREANRGFESDVAYMQTDEWKKEEAEHLRALV